MPDVFTPEQIAQLLEAFFKAVGTRQYIGARYVPLFGRKDETSIAWDNSAPYEPLTVVLYQGNSFTSRQYVPAGVEITNEEFWAETGNYNAQIEEYRRIAQAALDAAQNAQSDIDTLLPKADFDSENTVKEYVDASVTIVQNDIDTLLPKSAFSSENTVKDYVDSKTVSVVEDYINKTPNRFVDLELFGMVRSEESIGSFRQSTLYYNNRIYSLGGGINNQGVIAEFSTQTGDMLRYENISSIGHGNGACIIDDYIYVCSGKRITKISPQTLSEISTIELYNLPYNISNVFNKDNELWCTTAGQNIYKIDFDNATFEFVVTIESAGVATQQGACYKDGVLYECFTYPNEIHAVDITNGKITQIFTIPNGDGYYPCNELEGLFIVNDSLVLAAAPYVNGGWNPTNITDAPTGVLFLFNVDIESKFNISASIGSRNRIDQITVNENNAHEFKPSTVKSQFSLEVACYMASYSGHATITIYNFNSTNNTLTLRDCNVNLIASSGSGAILNLHVYNSHVAMSRLKVSSYAEIISSYFTSTGSVTFEGSLVIDHSVFNANNVTIMKVTDINISSRSIINGYISEYNQIENATIGDPKNQITYRIATTGKYIMNALSAFKDTTLNALVCITRSTGAIIIVPLSASEILSYCNGNTITKTTGNTRYPGIQFNPTDSSVMLSLEATPTSYNTSANNDISIVAVGTTSLF